MNAFSLRRFLGRVDPRWGRLADSRLRDVDHHPCETLPDWRHFWDEFDEHLVPVTLNIHIYVYIGTHISNY